MCGGKAVVKGTEKRKHLCPNPLNKKEYVIDTVLRSCIPTNLEIFVLVASHNLELIHYINDRYPAVKVIELENDSMYTTLEVALTHDHAPVLLIKGDLINITESVIRKYVDSKLSSALMRVLIPWGLDIKSKKAKLIRRGDIGDAILLLSTAAKDEYLSEKNKRRAKKFFRLFYPDKKFDMSTNNDVQVWLSYALFSRISNRKKMKKNDGSGSVLFFKRRYMDLD